MNIESTHAFTTWGYPGVALVGIVLVIASAVISHLLVRVTRKILHAATDGDIGGTIIANVIRVAVWALGVSFILSQCFGMNPSVIWGALGVGGIALSLGLQNTVSNLIGGLQLSLSRDVSVGDWIIIGNGVPARVIDINWRLVKLQDEYKNLSLVPNSVLNSTAVQVLAEPYALYFDIALEPGADTEKVGSAIVAIARDALDEAGMRFEGMTPVLSITGTTVDSVATRLKVFSLRDYTQIQINNVVMPPVLAYLREAGALAHCYSG